MALGDYATRTELKARLRITDTVDDTILDAVITAVSRQIDNHTRRRFYTSATDEDRFFTARNSQVLMPGDFVSVTTIATDENGDGTFERTWASTDYDLMPYNAVADGQPYSRIEVSALGRYRFPGNTRSVKITGKFGYAVTTPDVVHEACLLQAERIFRRRDAPFGIAGADPVGMLGGVRLLARLDPDVELLLAGLRRLLVA